MALSAAVVSLAEREGRRGHGEAFRGAGMFSLLLNMVCCWCPGVSSTMLATEAGCAAAMHAFAMFKVRLLCIL